MPSNLLGQDVALDAIHIFLGKRFCNLDGKDAVLRIVEMTEPNVRSAVAEEAILLCINSYLAAANDKSFFRNVEQLSLALVIAAAVTIGNTTAELLVEAAAGAGFHGFFPALPERLLSRPMKGAEVVALISSYVGDRAVRATEVEDKLKRWASAYLNPDGARIEHGRLRDFAREWDNEIDL